MIMYEINLLKHYHVYDVLEKLKEIDEIDYFLMKNKEKHFLFIYFINMSYLEKEYVLSEIKKFIYIKDYEKIICLNRYIKLNGLILTY